MSFCGEQERNKELLKISGLIGNNVTLRTTSKANMDAFKMNNVNNDMTCKGFRFEKKAINNISNWISEYRQTSELGKRRETRHLSHYIQFRQKSIYSGSVDTYPTEDLTASARLLLKQLSSDTDSKLENSKFIVFLKKLADNDGESKVNLKENLGKIIQKGISEEEWEEWNSINRGWTKFESTGYGYDDYAIQKFNEYFFHLNLGENYGKSLIHSLMELENIVKHEHEDFSAWYTLGKLNSLLGDDQNALVAFRAACQEFPDVHLDYASACINQSCIPEACEAIRKWVITKTGDQEQLLVADNIAANIDKMLSLVAGIERTETVCKALGLMYLIMGDFEKALYEFDQSTALISMEQHLDVALSLNRVGAMKANMGYYDAAVADYQKAMLRSLHQDSCGKIFENLAICYHFIGRKEEAKKKILEALECGPKSSQAEDQQKELLRSISVD